jgi:hypothetical protein
MAAALAIRLIDHPRDGGVSVSATIGGDATLRSKLSSNVAQRAAATSSGSRANVARVRQ